MNENFIEKAENLKPKLNITKVSPISIVKIEKTSDDWEVIERKETKVAFDRTMYKGDSVCFDFGDHCVGYVTFKIKPIGNAQDAPAHIRLKMGEIPCEIGEDFANYDGGLSSSWLQQEFIHVDVLPATVRMPRRYAFRYLEFKILDTSNNYNIVLEEILCENVTSADRALVEKLPKELPDNLKQMDKVAIKTLEDCMQYVFEDGPKRDRRLWVGDLRLQALANYYTFHNIDLVKRCLYLFAGLHQEENRVGACLYIEPDLHVDGLYLFDYSLLFVSTLYDYYMETKDEEALGDLWETAYNQIALAMKRVDEDGVVKDSDDWWCFLDWGAGLNKQAGGQGVLLYALRQALELANILKDSAKANALTEMIAVISNGAKKKLWNEELGLFESGEMKQVSWASQIWLVLGKVYDKAMNQKILENLIEKNPEHKMVTPYLHHYFVEALLENDMKDIAIKHMEDYWGEMLKDGADCFFEVYDPEDKKASPYGSRIINSYCHAWSCTPTYFIRKYLL